MFVKLLLALSVLVASHSVALADSGDDKSLISVDGKAEVKVVPDEVHVSFAIHKNAKALKEAQNQNDEVANKILRVMKNKLGIDEKHIQTNFINVNPIYTYVRCNNNQKFVPANNQNCNTQVFSHFETKKGIAVKLKEIDKLEKLLQEAIDAGVTNINNVQFVSSKYDELQEKAQLLAAKDAKNKAEAIAESLGVSIGDPYRINVSLHTPSYARNNMMTRGVMAMEMADSASGTISVGQLTITASVNAQFELE